MPHRSEVRGIAPEQTITKSAIAPDRAPIPEISESTPDSDAAKFYRQTEFQLAERFGFLETGAENVLLNSIIDRLTPFISVKNIRARCVDSLEANAFVIDGFNDLFCYKGLLREMVLWCQKNKEDVTEDMIAMAVAHEITHLEQKTAPKGGPLAEHQAQLNREYDADRGALFLIAKAGYNPREGIKTLRFLHSLGDHSSLFSTHPRSADRAQAIAAEVESNDTVMPHINTRPRVLTAEETTALLRESGDHPGNRLYQEAGRQNLDMIMANCRIMPDALEVIAVAASHDEQTIIAEISESPILKRLQAQSIFLYQIASVVETILKKNKVALYYDAHHDYPDPLATAKDVDLPSAYIADLNRTFAYEKISDSETDLSPIHTACEKIFSEQVAKQHQETINCLTNSLSDRDARLPPRHEKLRQDLLALLDAALAGITAESLAIYAQNSRFNRGSRDWQNTRAAQRLITRETPEKIIEWCLTDGSAFFHDSDKINDTANRRMAGVLQPNESKLDRNNLATPMGRADYLKNCRQTRLLNIFYKDHAQRATKEQELFQLSSSSETYDYDTPPSEYSGLPPLEYTAHRQKIEADWTKIITKRFKEALSPNHAEYLARVLLPVIVNGIVDRAWADAFVEQLSTAERQALCRQLPLPTVKVPTSASPADDMTALCFDLGPRLALCEITILQAAENNLTQANEKPYVAPTEHYQKLRAAAQNYPPHAALFREQALKLLGQFEVSGVGELEKIIAPFIEDTNGGEFIGAVIEKYWNVFPLADLFKLFKKRTNVYDRFNLTEAQLLYRARTDGSWEKLSSTDRCAVIENVIFDFDLIPDHSRGLFPSDAEIESDEEETSGLASNEEYQRLITTKWEELTAGEQKLQEDLYENEQVKQKQVEEAERAAEAANTDPYTRSMGTYRFKHKIFIDYLDSVFETHGETGLIAVILKMFKDKFDDDGVIIGSLKPQLTTEEVSNNWGGSYKKYQTYQIRGLAELSLAAITNLLSQYYHWTQEQSRDHVYYWPTFSDKNKDLLQTLYQRALADFNNRPEWELQKFTWLGTKLCAADKDGKYTNSVKTDLTTFVPLFNPTLRTLKENIDLIIQIVPPTERDQLLKQCLAAYQKPPEIWFDESLYPGGLISALYPVTADYFDEAKKAGFSVYNLMNAGLPDNLPEAAQNYDDNDPSIFEIEDLKTVSLRWQLAEKWIEKQKLLTDSDTPLAERARRFIALIPEKNTFSDGFLKKLEKNFLAQQKLIAKGAELTPDSLEPPEKIKLMFQALYEFYQITIPQFYSAEQQSLFSRRADFIYNRWLRPDNQTLAAELARISTLYPAVSFARDESLMALANSTLVRVPADAALITQMLFSVQRRTADEATLGQQSRLEIINSVVAELDIRERQNTMLWILGLAPRPPLSLRAIGGQAKRSFREIPEIIFGATAAERKELFLQLFLGPHGLLEPTAPAEEKVMLAFLEEMGKKLFNSAQNKVDWPTYSALMTIWKTALTEHGPQRRANIMIEMIEASRGEQVGLALSIQTFLNAMGPVFIKGGQILSAEESAPGIPLLPADINQACVDLKQKAKTFSRLAAVQSLDEDKEYDSAIQPKLMSLDTLVSAASIKQVYTGTLSDDTVVVEKILRPSIKKHLDEDIRVLDKVMAALKPILKIPPRLKDRIIAWVQTEANFDQEVANHRMLEKTLTAYQNQSVADDPMVRLPRLFNAGPLHIREEFIVGHSFDDLARAPERFTAEQMSNFKLRALDCLLYQIFESGVFHADPHGGNIFINNADEIIFLDTGSVGKIEAKLLPNLRGFFRRLLAQNIELIRQGIAPFIDGLDDELMAQITAVSGDLNLSPLERLRQTAFIISESNHPLHPGFDLMLKTIITSLYLMRDVSFEQMASNVMKYLLPNNE